MLGLSKRLILGDVDVTLSAGDCGLWTMDELDQHGRFMWLPGVDSETSSGDLPLTQGSWEQANKLETRAAGETVSRNMLPAGDTESLQASRQPSIAARGARHIHRAWHGVPTWKRA